MFFFYLYFSLITDGGVSGFCWVFVVMIGGGVIDNDISGGMLLINGFCCVCVCSISSIAYSVCDAYRPKSEIKDRLKYF